MAWPSRTWVTGEFVTAALMNAEVRDNSEFIGARVGRTSTAFQIASGSFIDIDWNSETFDSDAFHDNSTNPSRLTVPSGFAGKYAVHGMLLMPGAVLGGDSVQIRIRKNGTTVVGNYVIPTEGASIVKPTISIYSLVDLAATDYVQLQGQQNSGSTRDVTDADETAAFFEMYHVGG